MTVYLASFIAISLLAINGCNRRQYKIAGLDISFWLAIILLALIAVLRGITVGADTKNYYAYFEDIAQLHTWKDLSYYADRYLIETGYMIYNKLLGFFFESGQTITVCNSILLFVALAIMVKKYSVKPVLSLFLYISLGIYQTALNMMPSSIACLIVLGSYCFIMERKLWKYLAMIVLAMQMHQSVFIFAFLYFLPKIRLTRFRAAVLFGAGGVLLMLYDRLLPVISLFVPEVYRRYLATSQITNGVVFIFHVLIFVFILVVTDFKKTDRTFNLYLWTFILELEFYWLSFRLEIFSRVSFLFSPVLILLVPYVTENMRFIKNKKLMNGIFYSLIGLQYVLRLCINNIGNTMPYMFFWQ